MLSKKDVVNLQQKYSLINDLYRRLNLKSCSNVLYVDGSIGELLPFMHIKHDKINYYNYNTNSSEVLQNTLFAKLKNKVVTYDTIGKCQQEKYDLIISENTETPQQLLNSLHLKGTIIVTGNERQSKLENVPGIIKQYTTDEMKAYSKDDSLHIMERQNEFQNSVFPVKNKYEVETPSGVDVNVILSSKGEGTLDIYAIRFDKEDLLLEEVKVKVYNVSKTDTIEICFKCNDATVHKSTHEVPSGFIHVVDSEYEQNIPKVICQTLEKPMIRNMHYRTVLNLKLMNPEYTYCFYDSKDRRNFISSAFGPDVLETYDGLISGAFKADLFRYCWLYAFGGVYVDCKMINRTALRNVIKNDDETYLCKDRIENAYQNCFICTVPKHANLLNCISECISRYKAKINKRVSFGSLYHTGPYLFYTCMKDIKTNCKFEGPFGDQRYEKTTIKNSEGSILFNVWFKDYYSNYNKIHNRPIWSQQWAQNEIYLSKRFDVSGLPHYSLRVYPNQIDDEIIKHLQFHANDNTIYFSGSSVVKSKNLKCVIFDEKNHIEQVVIVPSKHEE